MHFIKYVLYHLTTSKYIVAMTRKRPFIFPTQITRLPNLQITKDITQHMHNISLWNTLLQIKTQLQNNTFTPTGCYCFTRLLHVCTLPLISKSVTCDLDLSDLWPDGSTWSTGDQLHSKKNSDVKRLTNILVDRLLSVCAQMIDRYIGQWISCALIVHWNICAKIVNWTFVLKR